MRLCQPDAVTDAPKKMRDALGKLPKRLHHPVKVMLVGVRW